MEKAVAEARKSGFAETLFGRRRYLPELTSSNFNVRAGAERMAMNMPVQGTAADMMKLAMIEIYKDFKNICPEAKMLLQVHDELVFEVPDQDVEKLSNFIKEQMENVVKLKVPVLANIGVAKNWGDAK
jgi:DNA polymerase-1